VLAQRGVAQQLRLGGSKVESLPPLTAATHTPVCRPAGEHHQRVGGHDRHQGLEPGKRGRKGLGTEKGRKAGGKGVDLTAEPLQCIIASRRAAAAASCCRCPQMLPIPCPKGFRTASNKDKSGIIEPFL
jgi:hypothetical protein